MNYFCSVFSIEDMINFDKVNKPSKGYTLVFPFIHFVHSFVFYKDFVVLNKENIPPEGEGFLVICNHQNGLNDAMGILYTLGRRRRPVFIARGDIFMKDGLAKLLRFFRIMPAFRKRDAGTEGLGMNEAIFKQSARIIEEGDVVALFPEAAHQQGHKLGTFKKGFARIAFKVVEETDFKTKLRILPLAHHYSNYFSAQSKMAMIVGEPFDFTELYDLYKTDPNRAITLLNEKARNKVNELMLNIEDEEHYGQYSMLCTIDRDIYIRRKGMDKRYFPNELTADKAIVKALDRCREEQSEVFGELMEKTALYKEDLHDLRLRDWIFRKRFLGGFWLRTIGLMLLFPFWLYGLICNCLPLGIGKYITGKMKDRMLHASIYFAIGIFVLPVWYLILFGTAWAIIGKFWIAFLFGLTLFPSLVLYIRCKTLLIKMYNRTRRFWLKVRKNETLKKAEELRNEIIALMDGVLFKD